MLTLILIVSNALWMYVYIRKCKQVGEVMERVETVVKQVTPRKATDITINGTYRRL